MRNSLLLICLIALVHRAGAMDADTDGDGLSDFHEQHKYCTNPLLDDSDGDGRSDGDWEERREYTYSVRTVVQVLPPVTPDAFSDDYQDARILDETEGYVELEVIHYPLNTVADAIEADAGWRTSVADHAEYLAPGLTANWDPALRDAITAAMKADGIDVTALDDQALVEQASRWLLEHARYVDGFSTFCSDFVDGEVRIYPGMEEAAARGRSEKNLTNEEQWQRELFAKGMFEHGMRGSCTSSAIYLNGCLRALGIPTRIVLAIPLIDASDERERAMLDRLRHHRVRGIVQRGTAGLQGAWASHTFNEVFVGGRWRRLNYDRLGQNTLDPDLFGLITHVATFNDWADGRMAATWGMRQAHRNGSDDDVFGGPNPYSTITISDHFGPHASIPNPPDPDDFLTLTIDRAWWFHQRPEGVDMRIDDPETAGHVVVRVVEGRPGEGPKQYARFYELVSKDFVLRAEGHPDVPLHATRGYWAAPEDGLKHFYLRIEPEHFARMAADVPYALFQIDAEGERRWEVREGVTLIRPEQAVAADAGREEADPEEEGPDGWSNLTIDWVGWSDATDSPTGPLHPTDPPVILARVGASDDFDEHKRFTTLADRRFFLEAEGHPTLKVGADIGGVTTATHSYMVIRLGPADWRDLAQGVEYTLRPQNAEASHQWRFSAPLRISR